VSSVTSERSLSDKEREEIEEAIEFAVKDLNVDIGQPPSVLQRKIHDYLVEYDETREVQDPDLVSHTALGLGALWGEQICREFGWEWIVAKRGSWEGIGITDERRRFLALPLQYFDSLVLLSPDKANLPSLRLYNAIKAGNMPAANPNQYVLVAHGGS